VAGHPHLSRDVRILFATRGLRLFAYGAVSVLLAVHLAALGFGAARIGLLLTLALAGDTAVSLLLTTRADRIGRRRTLAIGALLMLFAGVAFAAGGGFPWLAAAATLGVLSPTGGEVGPFLAVEQAALAETTSDASRTRVFAWYHLTGSFATALGSLAAGAGSGALEALGLSREASHRPVFLLYAAIAVALVALFGRLGAGVEPRAPEAAAELRLGIGPSRKVVTRLASLFALDSFGGGLALQSFLAWWLADRFAASPTAIGTVFFATSVLAGLSAPAAAALARRFGLVNTMVWTHVPANLLLVAFPFAPTLSAAIAILAVRGAISQMDVPTRQSYVMAVVRPEERAAAAGVTGIARTLGGSASPVLAGLLLQLSLPAAPFVAAGGLKLLYDFLLLAVFRRVRPPEEADRVAARPRDLR
jgi:MFS family permease